jgi:hypothetical protein
VKNATDMIGCRLPALDLPILELDGDTRPKIVTETCSFPRSGSISPTTRRQAMTYQIGKLQIVSFLAEARMKEGDKFNLRNFHDFVWQNGNVSIALQQEEYLKNLDTVSREARR